MMEHGDAREGELKGGRGNWRMAWVTSTLHTTSEHGVSSITTADAHTSAELTPPTGRFKWTRPFRLKRRNLGLWACAITFQLASTVYTVKLCDFVTVAHADSAICQSHANHKWATSVAKEDMPKPPVAAVVILGRVARE